MTTSWVPGTRCPEATGRDRPVQAGGI